MSNSLNQKLVSIINCLEDIKDQSEFQQDNAIHEKLEKVYKLAAVTAINSELDEFTLLNKILNCAMKVVQAEGAGLTLYDNKKDVLVFRAAVGLGSEGIIGYEIPPQGSVHGIAFSMRNTQISIPQHKISEDSTKAHFKNVMVSPLYSDDEAIGTISVVNRVNEENFTQEDRIAFEYFADIAADAIEQHEKILSIKSAISNEDFDVKINTQLALLQEIIPQIVSLAEENSLDYCKNLLQLSKGSK